MSRPTKLTPERSKVICESRKLGATIDHCAARAGIKSPTLYGWLAKGKRGVSPEYTKFFNDFKKAEGSGIAYHLGVITKAGQEGSWQASAWILERAWGYNRSFDESANDNDLMDASEVDVKSLLEEINKSNEAIKGFLAPVVED